MRKVNLQLKRTHLKETYTIGSLYIDGIYFCDTLEDKVRDYNKDGDLLDAGETKVFGETAIPYEKYKVIITNSQRFKRRLPLLLNVPHFQSIRIHGGNTAEHTHGCILVGVNDIKGAIRQSQDKLSELMLILDSNEVNDITIEII